MNPGFGPLHGYIEADMTQISEEEMDENEGIVPSIPQSEGVQSLMT